MRCCRIVYKDCCSVVSVSHSVGVDFSAELNRSQKTLPHRLLGGVGRHVDLVVANVRLWKGGVVATHCRDRVRVALFLNV